jgi:uncharacterized coiled-coil protein SlyX
VEKDLQVEQMSNEI